MAASLKDTFTDTDGVKLEAHTGEGGAWTKANGSGTTAEITTGKAHVASAESAKNAIYVFASTLATNDQVCLVNFKKTALVAGAANVAGAIVRGDAEGKNCYRLHLDTEGKLVLSKRVEGTFTTLKEEALTAPTENEEGSIKLEAKGTTLKCYRNGSLKFEFTDSSITSGGHPGIFLNRGEGSTKGFQLDSIEAEDLPVETKPTVATGTAATMRPTTATVLGTVNPNGKATEYRFEYGSTAAYGSTTPWTSAGSGSAAVAVEAALTGLTKFSKLHFRLVAKNSFGETLGADATFQTAPVFTGTILLVASVPDQSNGVGKGKSSEAPTVPAERGFKFEGGELKQLADPVSSAETGSCWPAMGKRFAELTGRQMVVVSVGTSGSAVLAKADAGPGNWSRTGALFAPALAAVKAAKKLLEEMGATVEVVAFPCQGEREAQWIDAAEGTKAEYKAGTEDVYLHLREELGTTLPIFISRTGRKKSGDSTGFQQVRAAQEEIAAADPYSYVVFHGAANFPAEGKMNPEAAKEELHYSQAGYNVMGETAAEAIALAEQPSPAAVYVRAAGGWVRAG